VRFCQDLRLHQEAYRGRPAKALFMARGGLRLRHLYNLYLESQGFQAPCPQADFYASRIAVAKACLLDDFEAVARLVLAEFSGADMAAVFSALLPDDRLRQFDEYADMDRLSKEPASVDALRHWCMAGDAARDVINSYFVSQSALLDQYVDQLIRRDAIDHPLLVDTGWAGSTQAMLMRRYPDLSWQGHYFGRYNYGKAAPSQFSHIIGVICENGYTWQRPMSAIFLHRHLVEGSCEMDVPSVEGYEARDDGTVAPVGGFFAPGVVEPRHDEIVFRGILDHFQRLEKGISPAAVCGDANRAARRLLLTILFPSREDIEALALAPRSADFGKEETVPIVQPPIPGRSLRDKLRVITRAIWPQAQIVFEFPRLRLPMQMLYECHRRFPRQSLLGFEIASRLLRFALTPFRRQKRVS
jgi:hypothetical protein